MSRDHRAENAVQLEVREDLGGSQARDGCRCLRPIPCWPRPQLVCVQALTRFGLPIHLVEFCVVDGDAPPERFDHGFTLPREQVPRDTHPNFLRKDGLTPAETEVKSQSPSVIALTGFRVC